MNAHASNNRSVSGEAPAVCTTPAGSQQKCFMINSVLDVYLNVVLAYTHGAQPMWRSPTSWANKRARPRAVHPQLDAALSQTWAL